MLLGEYTRSFTQVACKVSTAQEERCLWYGELLDGVGSQSWYSWREGMVKEVLTHTIMQSKYWRKVPNLYNLELLLIELGDCRPISH